MGRRSTKTTKTGKFMNPTDQYRKEMRRKELKKNKKQRQAVREAVLRMKDPGELLVEIEEIEKLEAESVAEPQPNEKGLAEKKRKLHCTLDRVLKYYQKSDPKKATDMKQLVIDSERKRREMSQLYNSYRAARSQYDVSDIPMPDSEGEILLPSDIPMPDETGPADTEGGILKPPGPPPGPPPGLLPPGPPPGLPPPDLKDYEFIEQKREKVTARKSVRFADAGGDEDKEDASSSESEDESGSEEEGEGEDSTKQDTAVPPGPPPGPPPGVVQQQAAGTAPPLMRVPPPPPAGPPPMFGQFPRMGIPPGPPPGIPPPGRPPPRPGMPMTLPHPLIPPNPNRPHIQSHAVLSAPPTINKSAPGDSGRSAVISAQPQIRNMQAEVTKFLPTSLRVRRDHPKVAKPSAKAKASQSSGAGVSAPQQRTVPSLGSRASAGGMQGDAYDAFMKEMQGLL